MVSIPIIAILLIFNIRRLIFTFTVVIASPKNAPEGTIEEQLLPDVLILMPCRDEILILPDACATLAQLDYPADKLRVVLIDDGSTDGTGEALEAQARDRRGWEVLRLPGNVGKAEAMNAALGRFEFGELVYIFDADHRPEPQIIRQAARYFADPNVAATTGFSRILNPVASPSAYYSTVESYINQLVTIRGKDRLQLAPALLGSNCGYRRDHLAKCGGFRKDAFSEDSDLTVAFSTAGYRLRFAETAVSYQQVPQSIRGYLKQHIRWGRGLSDVARGHSLEVLRHRGLGLPLRLELLLFTAGYLDRMALIGAVLMTAASYLSGGMISFPLGILLFALLTPLLQILALFVRERMPLNMWVRLPLIPVFFTFDIFAAALAILGALLNRPLGWGRTERVVIQR
jgi:cellulose synthase/poly-beta-1,6-N-acetylglucosamine synthase-like glycosyltransferase